MKNFNLMILADSPSAAMDAQSAGIDRIFYDLEYIGKAERQRGLNSVKSMNSIDDLPAIRKVVTTSQLLVRTNPIHAYTKQEVDKAINFGADILMLPMAVDHHDVQDYVSFVNGRSKICIMIETASSLARIDNILSISGVDEIFIGLNDLHLSMGLTFMFELLSGGLVEYVANTSNASAIPFGFGGIARIGEGMLPSDNILGEHVRLGSSSVILSRTFKGVEGVDLYAKKIDLKEEVDKVRSRLIEIENWGRFEHEENIAKIKDAVAQVVAKLHSKV